MLLIAEVGGEGRCIKLDKIPLGRKKLRSIDPDLWGDDPDGTGKLAFRVEDWCTDPYCVIDVFSTGNGIALLTDLF